MANFFVHAQEILDGQRIKTAETIEAQLDTLKNEYKDIEKKSATVIERKVVDKETIGCLVVNMKERIESETLISEDGQKEITKIEAEQKRLREQDGSLKSDLQTEMEFASELTAAGYQPLAILKKSAFAELCRKTGRMVRFENMYTEDSEYKTHLNIHAGVEFASMLIPFSIIITILAAFVSMLMPTATLTAFSLTISLISLLTFLHQKQMKYKSVSLIVGLVAFCIATFGLSTQPIIELRTGTLNVILFIAAHSAIAALAGGIVGLIALLLTFFLSATIEKFFSDVVMKIIMRFPQNILMKILWQGGVDREKPKEEDKQSPVKIGFHIPRDETFIRIFQKLSSNSKYKLCIAADYDTIILDDQEVIEAGTKDLIWRDPIIYTENNEKTHVAIFAQIGEFPSEKKVMNWLEKNAHKFFFN
ncbi:MAG: hypothetical protein NUV82_00085 [Candidatus Komeilibacteria bacterium]|nr:hypothetical protein [Candidatus Komeilibacteria bacterium]